MLSKVTSSTVYGLDAYRVDVEVDMSPGLPMFSIVGLPDAAVKESVERVRSAIQNSGYEFPRNKTVVNLAPADIKKAGSHYDLGIALGYLLASGQVRSPDLSRALVVGELALDGHLRPINGALSIAHLASARGFTHVLLPEANAREAAIIKNVQVIPVRTLRDWLFMMGTVLLPHDDAGKVSSQCRLKAGPLLEHQFPKLFDPQLV